MANKRQPIPFGKYLLLDRVNIGGMAEVWKAKTFGAEGFEKLVAIKRILPNIAEDEEFISMFIDEAKISVQLTHANVAQVFDLGKIGDSYYIAMEYVSGKDLRAIFDKARKRGEPAPIPLVCYALSKSSEGLDYAHRKKDAQGNDLNIVHRDVSPQNILISYDGECKVIDFGIAKAANKATKTQAGILKGKFGYMSPEQVRGLPLDRRSDVFALGVVLYEMLTGERLFVGESDFSVLEKVRAVDILPPSTYNRRIPPALEKIVLKALAKDVEDRYSYASELGDELQRFLITSDSIFSRKDLMQFMKSTFAEDVEREKIKLAEYAEVKLPPGMAALAGVSPAAPAPAPAPRAAPPPPPSQPPPADNGSDATMIGAMSPVENTDPGLRAAPRPPGPPPGVRATGTNIPAVGRPPPGPPPGVNGRVAAPVGAPRLTSNGMSAVPGGPVGNRATSGGMPALGPPGANGRPRGATGQINAIRPPPPRVEPVSTGNIADDLADAIAGESTLPPAGPRSRNAKVADDLALDDADEATSTQKPPGTSAGGGSKKVIIGAVGTVGVLAILAVVGVVVLKGNTGSLVVSPTPSSGVTALVDGQPSPTGLSFANLKAGPHQLVLQAPGYDILQQQVVIEKDQTAIVNAKLKKQGGGDDAPKPAAAEQVNAKLEEPLGAELSIDDKVVRPKGKTDTYKEVDAYDGSKPHTVTAKLDGYEDFKEEFPAGKPIKDMIELVKKK